MSGPRKTVQSCPGLKTNVFENYPPKLDQIEMNCNVIMNMII